MYAVVDTSFENPHANKRRRTVDSSADVATIKEDIRDIKMSMDDIFKVTSLQQLPTGLQYLLSETFKCKICHSTISPPVIITKCCKSILGCSECSSMWYSGPEALSKPCPCCRSERGYNETMNLRGLDDLIIKLKEIWGDESNHNHESD